jgi:hypothetical protein
MAIYTAELLHPDILRISKINKPFISYHFNLNNALNTMGASIKA